eukprot:TRINITY_DN7930_c0_g1_i1.p1 TRINITY_DN7930_c0_g1~~TRINITY_DN7930_c0_g1_i1.p1  ORF type:complete len:1053 (+),score=219.80 TRINITY_DN7930_c0_g1_i1:58-3216(+)
MALGLLLGCAVGTGPPPPPPFCGNFTIVDTAAGSANTLGSSPTVTQYQNDWVWCYVLQGCPQPLSITFFLWSFNGAGTCYGDFLEVRTGGPDPGSPLWPGTGYGSPCVQPSGPSTPPTHWTAPTNTVTLRLVSDSTGPGSGFELLWQCPSSPTAAPAPPPPPTMAPAYATLPPSQPPLVAPTDIPTAPPTGNPVASPSAAPLSPTASPSVSPTSGPVAVPTWQPSKSPDAPPAPTGPPVASPTIAPSPTPTSGPGAGPTRGPSQNPAAAPTGPPAASPTLMPSPAPTSGPVTAPTRGPSLAPAAAPAPTVTPAASPTMAPLKPTLSPRLPSAAPSADPTSTPAAGPTREPSRPPSQSPAAVAPAPTDNPTRSPSQLPSSAPVTPVEAPTSTPVKIVPPTGSPAGLTPAPTLSPTGTPTLQPRAPSAAPTGHPSAGPVRTPGPSASPTLQPAVGPTSDPTGAAAQPPTLGPLTSPSASPAAAPSRGPATSNAAAPPAPPPVPTAPSPPSAPPSLQPSPSAAAPTKLPTAAPTVAALVPPEIREQQRTAAVAATSLTAVSGVFAAGSPSPNIAKLAMLSKADCGDDAQEMDWTLHPTGVALRGSAHVGAVVSNTCLLGGFIMLHWVLVNIVHAQLPKCREGGKGATDWQGSCGAVRFPSLAVFPYAFLFQGSVLSVATLLFSGSTEFAAVGFAGVLVVVVAPFAGLWFLTDASFAARYSSSSPQGRCRTVKWFLVGEAEWVSTDGAFVQRWGEVFSPWKGGRRRRFLLVELGHIVPMTFAAVRPPDGWQDCTANTAAMAGVLAIHFAALVATLPYIAPFENAFLLLEALLQVLAVVGTAVGYSSGDAAHWTFTGSARVVVAAMYVMLVKALLDLAVYAGDMWQQCRGGEEVGLEETRGAAGSDIGTEPLSPALSELSVRRGTGGPSLNATWPGDAPLGHALLDYQYAASPRLAPDAGSLRLHRQRRRGFGDLSPDRRGSAGVHRTASSPLPAGRESSAVGQNVRRAASSPLPSPSPVGRAVRRPKPPRRLSGPAAARVRGCERKDVRKKDEKKR